jgi:hypothetical protein
VPIEDFDLAEDALHQNVADFDDVVDQHYADIVQDVMQDVMQDAFHPNVDDLAEQTVGQNAVGLAEQTVTQGAEADIAEGGFQPSIVVLAQEAFCHDSAVSISEEEEAELVEAQSTLTGHGFLHDQSQAIICETPAPASPIWTHLLSIELLNHADMIIRPRRNCQSASSATIFTTALSSVVKAGHPMSGQIDMTSSSHKDWKIESASSMLASGLSPVLKASAPPAEPSRVALPIVMPLRLLLHLPIILGEDVPALGTLDGNQRAVLDFCRGTRGGDDVDWTPQETQERVLGSWEPEAALSILASGLSSALKATETMEEPAPLDSRVILPFIPPPALKVGTSVAEPMPLDLRAIVTKDRKMPKRRMLPRSALQYLPRISDLNAPVSEFFDACQRGDLDLAINLAAQSERYPFVLIKGGNLAAAEGHREIVRFLMKKGFCSPSWINAALQRGNTQMALWLYQLDVPITDADESRLLYAHPFKVPYAALLRSSSRRIKVLSFSHASHAEDS